MIKKWIIIPIEVKVRDCDSRLLIAYEALNNGFNVIIGDQRQIYQHIDKLPRSIYYDKSAAQNKINFYKKLTSKGFIIVSQDEEGLSCVNNREKYLKQRVCEETLKLLKKQFTWGKTEIDVLKSRYPHYKQKFRSTGNPRIDLLRQKFRSIYKDNIVQIKKEYDDYIIFNSSFTVNHKLGKENLFTLWKNLGRVKNNKEKVFYENRIDFFERTFNQFVDLIIMTSKKFPQKKILVRPHPAEDEKFWLDLSSKYKNICIRKDGNVYPWIIAADIVIHSSCTTGIEAYIAGTPVISYIPYTDNEYVKHISNEASECFNKKEEVMDRISEIIISDKENRNNTTNEKNLKNHIQNINGEFAYESIIKELIEIDIDPDSYQNFKVSLTKQIINKFKSYIKMIRSNKKEAYKKAKFDSLSKSEVKSYFKKLKKIIGFEIPKIRSLDSRLFILYK